MKSLDSLPSTHPEITGADVQEYCRKRNLTVIPNELLHEMQRSWSETAQPERKKGKWIKMSDADGVYWACSECGEDLPRASDYDPQFDLFPRLKSIEKTYFCPNCGADMRTPTQVRLDEADDVMMGGGNGRHNLQTGGD